MTIVGGPTCTVSESPVAARAQQAKSLPEMSLSAPIVTQANTRTRQDNPPARHVLLVSTQTIMRGQVVRLVPPGGTALEAHSHHLALVLVRQGVMALAEIPVVYVRVHVQQGNTRTQRGSHLASNATGGVIKLKLPRVPALRVQAASITQMAPVAEMDKAPRRPTTASNASPASTHSPDLRSTRLQCVATVVLGGTTQILRKRPLQLALHVQRAGGLAHTVHRAHQPALPAMLDGTGQVPVARLLHPALTAELESTQPQGLVRSPSQSAPTASPANTWSQQATMQQVIALFVQLADFPRFKEAVRLLIARPAQRASTWRPREMTQHLTASTATLASTQVVQASAMRQAALRVRQAGIGQGLGPRHVQTANAGSTRMGQARLVANSVS